MPVAIHVQYNNHTVKYVSHHLQTALFYPVIQHPEYPTIPVAHIHTTNILYPSKPMTPPLFNITAS
jgi:protein-S-isoprenylcysteine O-methyltransferase Ste14